MRLSTFPMVLNYLSELCENVRCIAINVVNSSFIINSCGDFNRRKTSRFKDERFYCILFYIMYIQIIKKDSHANSIIFTIPEKVKLTVPDVSRVLDCKLCFYRSQALCYLSRILHEIVNADLHGIAH